MAATLFLTLSTCASLAFFVRFSKLLSRPTAVVAAVVVFLSLIVIPFHLLGLLELMNVVQGLSLGMALAAQALLVTLLLLWAAYTPVPSDQPPSSDADPSSEPSVPAYLKLAFVCVSACWMTFLLDGLSSFPAGWDARAYHYPLVVRWLQLGIANIPPSLDWRYALPGNGEVGMMVGLATGFEPAATLVNLLAALLAATSVYIWSLRLTRNAEAGALASLTFLTVPIIQFQAFTGYVDLYGASLLLAAAVLVLSVGSSPWQCWVVGIAGLACGIGVGTKPTMWPYAGLVMVAAVARSAQVAEKLRSRLALVLTFLTCVVATSGFWFLRAYLLTGNPVFPFEVAFAGTTIWTGIGPTDITAADFELNFVRSGWEWLVYPWVEYKRAGFSYSPGSGLGPVWTAFCPVGLIYGLYLCWRGDNGTLLRITASVAVLALIGWSVWLGRVPRFGIPIIGLTCIVSAGLFDRFARERTRAFTVLFTLSAAVGCVLSGSSPAREFLDRIGSGSWTRAEVYGYPQMIDDLPKGSRVLNLAGTTMTYPLAGKALSNCVIPKEWAPQQIDASWLRRERIDYVVVRSGSDSWAGRTAEVDLAAIGARLVFGRCAGEDCPNDLKRFTVWRADGDIDKTP